MRMGSLRTTCQSSTILSIGDIMKLLRSVIRMIKCYISGEWNEWDVVGKTWFGAMTVSTHKSKDDALSRARDKLDIKLTKSRPQTLWIEHVATGKREFIRLGHHSEHFDWLPKDYTGWYDTEHEEWYD